MLFSCRGPSTWRCDSAPKAWDHHAVGHISGTIDGYNSYANSGQYLDLGQMLSHYSHYRGVPMKPNGTNHTIHSEGKSKDDTQWVFSHVLSVSHDSEMGLSTGKSFVTCKWFLTSLKVSWNHLGDLKLRTLPSNGHFCGSWLESLWDKITIPIQFLDIPSTASA